MPRKTTAIFGCLILAGLVRAGDTKFDSNGVKIRYVVAGEGEPVVLIHGWMGDSSMWGRDWAGNTKIDASGAAGFQIIAFDCRGHGNSDKPHDPSKYGREMADDVVRLLDHLKLKRAHLIGYSSGAFIAGKVAAMHPERVISIVYAGQAPLVEEAKKSGSNEVKIFAKAVEEGKGLGSYIMAVTPEGKKPTAEQAKWIAHLFFTGKDVKAFAIAGLSFERLYVKTDELKRCSAPILFVHGSEESTEVKDRVTAVHKLLGRGRIQIIKGGDHMTTLAKPEFSATLTAFIQANEGK